MDPIDQGIRYPPNRVRDALHRVLFGLVAAPGPSFQDWVLRHFFERLYRRPNPWSYEGSPYQRHKCGQALALIPQSAYGCVLEVGCGEGAFSERLLAERDVREFIGVDISTRAIARAKSRCYRYENARFDADNIFSARLPAAFDLIVVCEVLYYLGGSAPDLAALLTPKLSPRGSLLLVHLWPEAELLHRAFLASGDLSVLDELVDEHSVRPFCVSLLGRGP